MRNEFDFLFRLLVMASSIALLLSLAGIYSVMSFTVSRRTREIGIRVALGVCMLACIVPTRRALRVEPIQALRAE